MFFNISGPNNKLQLKFVDVDLFLNVTNMFFFFFEILETKMLFTIGSSKYFEKKKLEKGGEKHVNKKRYIK